jgi:hypothetical protein
MSSSSTPAMEEGADRKLVGVIGLYDDVNALIGAAESVRDAGYKKWDCHTPYPVHGLDDAMGLKPSPMPYITLGMGGVGVGLALLMQWWMSAVDYPVRIGGKEYFSWPAFIPITFELFTLLAAISTFVAMIILCKLGRWHSPLHDSGVMIEVTTSRHGVVLQSDDALFSEDGARALLEGTGCKDIRPLYEFVETYEGLV